MRYYTSESVSAGHPDKLADQISDAILDAYLTGDPLSRVACETLTTTGLVIVAGEVTSTAQPDLQRVVRDTIRRVGYTDARYGLDADSCAVMITLDRQSPDIASGVNQSEEWRAMTPEQRALPRNLHSEVGAGDQGLMFGYATDETPELMPLPLSLAHGLTRALHAARENGTLPWARPDAKAQVTVARHGERTYVDTIVISQQHAPGTPTERIHDDIMQHVILPVIPPALFDGGTRLYINPSGQFVIGGPHGDTGLTGRKIIVDTYGGAVPHGGGAFSGKDPTKVDRSAAYYARYVAKNIVAAGLARRALVEIAYAIGRAQPVSIRVDTFGTSLGGWTDEELTALVQRVFDARPQAIIAQLDLRRPIYAQTAAYGHFGRPDLPWERTDRAEQLARELPF